MLALLAIGGAMLVGCGGPPEEPAANAVGEPPPIQQAEPGMLSPEERARQGADTTAGGDGG